MSVKAIKENKCLSDIFNDIIVIEGEAVRASSGTQVSFNYEFTEPINFEDYVIIAAMLGEQKSSEFIYHNYHVFNSAGEGKISCRYFPADDLSNPSIIFRFDRNGLSISQWSEWTAKIVMIKAA